MGSMFNRRTFLKTIGAGVAGLALEGCSRPFTNPDSKKLEKPNVLFICVDDLNDWIGCLGGHPDTKTPNIDLLAERGVLFTNAHCAAPACNPSRAALMTGIRPSTSGIYGNHEAWRKSPVLKEAVTLPQHFMNHGYYAAGSGKIYHGRYPDPPSWDQYWPSKDKQKPDDPMPSIRPLNGIPRPSPDWGPIDVTDDQMGDWKVTDWVCEQLGKKHDKPFFLGCGIYRPHLPWFAPKKYFDLHPLEKVTLPNVKQDDLDDVPPIGRKMAKAKEHKKIVDHNQWRKGVQAYLACVSFADKCVGKVIDALDASEYADNTIIVFWADHGWHLGEKLHWKKFTLWEEATRNPMIFVVPGMTRSRSRCNRPVSLMDIYPTLSELCGFQPKSELQGVSIAPLLKDPQRKWDRPALTTWGRNNHSLRSQRWRYIRYSDGTEELYDHDNDANEWHNLADKPEHDRIKKELAKWLPKVNAE
jgi:arylsulfatase A-like enzyme